jgi:hypothetical protein
MSNLPHFLNNRLTDGGEVVSLMRRRPLPPGRFLALIYVRSRVNSRATERLEGLGKLKKSNDLIGDRTHDLPACSIVPQLTTLPRAPPGISLY